MTFTDSPEPDVSAAPATLHFGDGEFAILRPGNHVICATSGRRIPLPVLRYWSVEHQEAYAGPHELMTRAAVDR